METHKNIIHSMETHKNIIILLIHWKFGIKMDNTSMETHKNIIILLIHWKFGIKMDNTINCIAETEQSE